MNEESEKGGNHRSTGSADVPIRHSGGAERKARGTNRHSGGAERKSGEKHRSSGGTGRNSEPIAESPAADRRSNATDRQSADPVSRVGRTHSKTVIEDRQSNATDRQSADPLLRVGPTRGKTVTEDRKSDATDRQSADPVPRVGPTRGKTVIEGRQSDEQSQNSAGRGRRSFVPSPGRRSLVPNPGRRSLIPSPGRRSFFASSGRRSIVPQDPYEYPETDEETDNKMSASSALENRLQLHSKRKEERSVTQNEPPPPPPKPRNEEKSKTVSTFMEKVREFCARADVFASAHNVPIHVLCIMVSTVIIPISAISIVWDLMAAIVFQIPDLSTINTPAFILFTTFIAIPLAMYGYMMEYLMHEYSRLAVIGLICVVVHPLLFTTRAFIEYFFDGFRGEDKIYFEGFNQVGNDAKFPIGIIRYRAGDPYSDSVAGKKIIDVVFAIKSSVNNAKGTSLGAGNAHK